jgi:hypothetical protein
MRRAGVRPCREPVAGGQEDRVTKTAAIGVGIIGWALSGCTIPTVNGTPSCNAGEVRLTGNVSGAVLDERYDIVSSSFAGGGFSTMSSFEASLPDNGRVFIAFNGYASDDPTYAQQATVRFPTTSKAAAGSTVEGGSDSTVSATTTYGRFVLRPIRKDGAQVSGEVLGCWRR